MDAGRRERLEGLVQDLVIAGPPFIVVQSPQQACEVAAARFDVAARDLARCLGALRAARLELSGAWDEARHGPLFADFSWQDFGPDEAQLLPVVLVVQSADLLASRDLPALSRLLASGRPVHVLAEQVPTRNPGLGADEDPLAGHRLDLGVVAFGLGQVFVQQGTPARHEELWAGFQAALASPSPALHLVFSGWFDGDDPELGGWLTASAAVQSRAQPLFRHDPRGDSWAGSMDVTGNPEPESDWAEGFSFQDFALLDPALAHHFTPDESGTVATEGGPLRASEALVLASADRRRAWLRLRELGGVANEHALAAATAALDAARATADAERKELAALHDAELQRLRADSARDAIQKLASALVDGRLGAPVARPPQRMVAAPTAPAPVAVPVPAVAETAPPEAAAEEEPEEAWIDSELCTSCNDCVEINPLLFVYDANKQATLGDLSQGTHKELVLAAEKCPSSCIYPGSP
jgi:pyruvate-ferredoxin/flavodoxin oxidoreductase